MDAIEIDLDGADDELVTAFAAVVRELALERRDLADPLTAIEADRRLSEQIADGAVEYVPSALLAPPMWCVHRDGVDRMDGSSAASPSTPAAEPPRQPAWDR